MNLIGFSHHYTKIHGQTHGKLIYADLAFVAPDDMGSEWMRYDTAYLDWDGTTCYKDILVPHKFYSMLVFLGNKNIPFTTYRYCPNFKNQYEDLVGEEFVFKFKGEPIPDGLKPKDGKFDVKILF